MQVLDCGYQQYAWGKHGDKSKVAKMVGKADDKEGRYAELWIGTHPSKPAKIQASGAVLKEDLNSGASPLLSAAAASDYVAKYGNDIPFLLKVLSVDKALSIQAHPEREHAKQLHAKDPAHYPDANHKPELVVALTPYKALCCFRPISEIAKHLETIPALRELVKNHANFAAAGANPDAATTKTLLKGALDSIYAQSAELVAKTIDQHLAQLPAEPTYDADQIFRMLSEQYPGDVGCWMVYILNLVHLNPGDALFLNANEPHSYLSGDSVEIMACSDNVVRAGLTPKFKDVPTLIEMLTYRTDSLAEAHFPNDNKAVQSYIPPQWCDEFMLTSVRVEAGASESVKLPSIGLGVVTDGKGVINGVEVAEGSTFVVSHEACANGVSVTAAKDQKLTAFMATINKSSPAAAKL